MAEAQLTPPGEQQFVDPAVSRRKFDRQIEDYRELEHDYRRRGWFLIEAAFPRVFVLLTAPQLNPAAVVAGVVLDYTNYDSRPPSVRLVNPFTREPYRYSQLPTMLNRGTKQQLSDAPEGVEMLVQQPLMQAHSPDEIPFLCLPGVREYHDHPAHSGDAWELHRAAGEGSLVHILQVIHTYGVAPIGGWSVQLVPQVTFGWKEPPA